MRLQVSDGTIDWRAGRHHDEDAPRPFESLHQSRRRIDASNVFTLRRTAGEAVRFLRVQVITGHRKTTSFHVEGEIAPNTAYPKNPVFPSLFLPPKRQNLPFLSLRDKGFPPREAPP